MFSLVLNPVGFPVCSILILLDPVGSCLFPIPIEPVGIKLIAILLSISFHSAKRAATHFLRNFLLVLEQQYLVQVLCIEL